MTDFSQRLKLVQQQIADAEAQANRAPQSVQLLAVSKTKPIPDIEAFYQLGQRAFGENYVQEGVEKAQTLAHLNITWHFIGPLQSNKTKAVAEHFHWLHTVDRLKIAQRLSEQRPSHLPPLNVLIQINVSQEASKAGVALSDVDTLADQISALPNLQLRGLMCIPAQQDAEALKQDFKAMQKSFHGLQSRYSQVDTLSMGMSGDLSLAVECGSTLVRIGTALFGARDGRANG